MVSLTFLFVTDTSSQFCLDLLRLGTVTKLKNLSDVFFLITEKKLILENTTWNFSLSPFECFKLVYFFVDV